MAEGIRTTNIPRQFAIDELLGNVTADGVEKTARIPIQSLTSQLAGSGPFILGNTIYALTKTALDAITPPNANMGGVVLQGVAAGYYARVGSAWVKGRGFPDTFAKVTLLGSGTVQTGAVKSEVDPASIEVFFAKVATPNTGPMTLSISGGLARSVRNLAGNPLSAGEWTGMVMFYLNDENQYQLLIDAGAAASAAASASAAQQALEDVLAGVVPDSAVTEPKLATSLSLVSIRVATTRAVLKALSTTRYGSAYLGEANREGVFTWKAGNFSAQVAADTFEGLYIKADAVAASAGAWVRQSSGELNVRWFGAKGDGTTNDAADLAAIAANTNVVFTPGVYYINTSVTIAANLEFMQGARLKLGAGVTVTISGRIKGADDGQFFEYPSSATLVLTKPGKVDLGWFYAANDGTQDVSYFINQMIASAPTTGRTIKIPNGKWLCNSTIDIGLKNFITLSGEAGALRSLIEDLKAPPAGVGALAKYPSGGSALVTGDAVGILIRVEQYSAPLVTAQFRVSGLTIDNLTLSGSTAAPGSQSAICIFGAADGVTISNNVIINFNKGGYAILADYADAYSIHDNWIAENDNGILLGVAGVQNRIVNNYFGARPVGESLVLIGQRHCLVSGNNVQDGMRIIRCVGGVSNNIIGNTFTSRFTGAFVFEGAFNCNKFSGNTIRIANNDSSWTANKPWPAPNYDPLARDTLYGVVYMNGGNDNDLSDNILDNYMPNNSVLIRNHAGDRNRYNNWTFAGAGSTGKIIWESGIGGDVVNSCFSSEFAKNSGTCFFAGRGLAV